MAEGGVLVAGTVGAGFSVDRGHEDDECAGLEPFFYDEAAAVAEHAAAEERRRQREKKPDTRANFGYVLVGPAHKAALERIYEYDPKKGHSCYTRFHMADLGELDLDEESPLGPMRYANEHPTETATNQYGRPIYKQGEKWFKPCDSANVFSVKIASSDVGFPIDVYGTVLARDDLDYKCVYLYKRDKDHCQHINSADDQLILTGPKRGLVLEDAIYFEINLKIKCDGGQEDKILSKGVFMLDGIIRMSWEKMVAESLYLNSYLSRVEVMLSFVKRAVEACIAVQVVHGEFYGKITAHTSSTHNKLVLYDSEVADAVLENRTVDLLRPIVVVYVQDILIVNIVCGDGAGKTERAIEFKAAISGGDEAEIDCGSFKMLVKITWSTIVRDFHRPPR